MAKNSIPKLPNLLKSKIYKTGQTRGADDDVIFQNRVNRNNTVIIPYPVFDACKEAPDNDGVYENGYVVLISPDRYFGQSDFVDELNRKGLKIGMNALLFYETRAQWHAYNPDAKGLTVANSRTTPHGGQYVARIPSTTAAKDEKINRGFITSGMKGLGIRAYEYASATIIRNCTVQLEYLYWKCYDAIDVSLSQGMSIHDINARIDHNFQHAKALGLVDTTVMLEKRIMDENHHTICPLCLERLTANGFFNKLLQAEGRDVPDLTVTQLNLFHINELRFGAFNHKPYNLGWGHHHCNTVVKDSGINETLNWMQDVVFRNLSKGYISKKT